MRTLRKPNGPRNVPAPPQWDVGDVLIRRGNRDTYFRTVKEISRWRVVLATIPGQYITYKGNVYVASSGQARILNYSLKEAFERYVKLNPDEYEIQEPF